MKLIETDVKGKGIAVAELDNRNSNIASEFYQILPIEAKANLRGMKFTSRYPCGLKTRTLLRAQFEAIYLIGLLEMPSAFSLAQPSLTLQ